MSNILRLHLLLVASFASVAPLGCTAGQQLGNPPDGGFRLSDGAISDNPGDDDSSPHPMDGNGPDSSTPTLPAGAKRFFVTSGTHNGNFGGRAGADQQCSLAAEGANLGGTWKALLDGATLVDVGPWYLLDGHKIFNNKANVLAGAPLVPPALTEQSREVSFGDFVWTGRTIDQPDLSNDTCTVWTSNAPYAPDGPGGTIGDPHFTSDEWQVAQDRFYPCSKPAHLYCLEQ